MTDSPSLTGTDSHSFRTALLTLLSSPVSPTLLGVHFRSIVTVSKGLSVHRRSIATGSSVPSSINWSSPGSPA